VLEFLGECVAADDSADGNGSADSKSGGKAGASLAARLAKPLPDLFALLSLQRSLATRQAALELLAAVVVAPAVARTVDPAALLALLVTNADLFAAPAGIADADSKADAAAASAGEDGGGDIAEDDDAQTIRRSATSLLLQLSSMFASCASASGAHWLMVMLAGMLMLNPGSAPASVQQKEADAGSKPASRPACRLASASAAVPAVRALLLKRSAAGGEAKKALLPYSAQVC
jgi:hypothetical protein